MSKDAKIITIPKISDSRGNLSVIEELKDIPFKIERTYWIYDVPGGVDRFGHAFKETVEFIVALSGSFDVVIDDGDGKKTFLLNTREPQIKTSRFLTWICQSRKTKSLPAILESSRFRFRK